MHRGRKRARNDGGAPSRGDRRDGGCPKKKRVEHQRPIGYNILKKKLEKFDGRDLAQFCLSDRSFLVLKKVRYSKTFFHLIQIK